MALWHKHQTMHAHTQHRELILEPNKFSTVKIERYRFPLNQTIVLGTPVALNLSSQPDVKIRPQRLTSNAPVPMFATLSEIKVANVAVTVGIYVDANGTDFFEFVTKALSAGSAAAGSRCGTRTSRRSPTTPSTSLRERSS
jgi:hypothetical protein